MKPLLAAYLAVLVTLFPIALRQSAATKMQQPVKGVEPTDDSPPRSLLKRNEFDSNSVKQGDAIDKPNLGQQAVQLQRLVGASEQFSVERNSRVVRRTQWKVFVTPQCQPCLLAKKDFQPWLTASGWDVSEAVNAHVRLIDGTTNPDEMGQHAIDHFPTFLLVQDGRELVRWNRYLSREEMARLYNVHAANELTGVVGAISIGSLKGQRANFATLIASARTLIGQEGSILVRWNRVGGDIEELTLTPNISIRVANPVEMTYAMEKGRLSCRFQPALRAKFRLGLPLEQQIAAVNVSTEEIVIELPRMVDLRIPIEP